MTRRLNDLLEDLRACQLCVGKDTRRPLPHAPRPIFQIGDGARLFICSQAPGARAHASGIPFQDPSGTRLRAWLDVTEEEFYDPSRIAIIPMGFCFPGHDRHGGDLPPRTECAKHWRKSIFDALGTQPETVLLVGSHAQKWHLGANQISLADTLRRWRTIWNGSRPRYLPLPHPSWRNTGWLKRNPWFETEILPHLRAEVRRLLKR